MKFTYSGFFLGSVMLATGFVACGGGGETTASTTTGSGGATSTSAATTSSTASAGGAGGSSATTTTGASSSSSSAASSSSSSGMPVLGYCTKPCGTVADCCPQGAINCPSNMYPNNYTCDKNACKSPECATTADCAAIDPKQDCLAEQGFNSCATTCVNDGDCLAPATCSGVDDNNKKYCLSSGGGCANDAACNGFGKCVNKVCACEKASDCTKPGFTACAL